jgi:hypothetical protein
VLFKLLFKIISFFNFYNKKSHRYDFFNIHIERAHKKEKVGELLQEKGLDLTGSTNSRKRDSLIIHLRDSGSVAKSINGRLAMLLECETCHQVMKLLNLYPNI